METNCNFKMEIMCPVCDEWHEAVFSHQNGYGQTVYEAVCGDYIELVTDEMPMRVVQLPNHNLNLNTNN